MPDNMRHANTRTPRILVGGLRAVRKVVGLIYAIYGAALTFSSPNAANRLNVWNYVPRLSASAWFAGFFALLLLGFMEGAFRFDRQRRATIAHYAAKPRERYTVACTLLEQAGLLVDMGVSLGSVNEQWAWYENVSGWWKDVSEKLLPLMDRHEAMEWRDAFQQRGAWERSALNASLEGFRDQTNDSRRALNDVRNRMQAFARRESVPAAWMGQKE